MTDPAPRISEDELARLEELAQSAKVAVLGLPDNYHAGLPEWHAADEFEAEISPDVVLRLIAAARSAPAAGLDAAWAEAEAALPEGAALVRLTWRIGMHEKFPPDEDFEARAEWWYGNDRPVESRYGPTPAAALLALAAALRESKP